MFQVVLHEPCIPPNTGNIIRLCANAGAALHLVEPLGFSLDDRQLRRAGLDYHEYASLQVHRNLDECLAALAPTPVFAFSTRGRTSILDTAFPCPSVLLFGSETQGLPAPLLETLRPAQVIALPMQPRGRSLNLSNAVAIALFEAWRQHGFAGARALRGGSSF